MSSNPPLSATKRTSLALLWLALLTLAGLWVMQQLQVSGDLRKFMPSAQTPAQRLLMNELGDSAGTRLLLLGLSGDTQAILAAQSKALRQTLAADSQFALVNNGEQHSTLEDIPPKLLPYRYVLAAPPQGFLQADYLHDALFERLQDLGSPAASLVAPLIGTDPTLETLRLAESWQPANTPQLLDDVWFDAQGQTALLLIQTHAAGFDPNGQAQAVAAIHNAFDAVNAGGKTQLTLTGPGAFSVEIGQRTQREASTIGLFDSIGLVLLLWLAYRRWIMPLLGVLPLASAGLAGLLAVALLFEQVHGITIAFGFTLIGVVQDYPIHLFSHQRRGVSAWQIARSIWPTLGTGVIATCIAYATFLLSGVDGLKQLAVFTMTALFVAALSTRFALPALLGDDNFDAAHSPWLARLWQRINQLPRPKPWQLAALVIAAAAAIVLPRTAFWQNDLSRLTPVPAPAMADDARLRQALGAPDVRYMLVLEASDTETVLQRSEALLPVLQQQVDSGALDDFDMAARYLPSAATQRARQQALPDSAALQSALDDALQNVPFQPEIFAPFIADVARAKQQPPLTIDALADTPPAGLIDGLLLQYPTHSTALVSLSGVDDAIALQHAVAAHGAQLLDMKAASESLVAAYRMRILWALALAAVLLALTVWLALRKPQRVWRVLLPMALTLVLVVAILRVCGVELNLFHIVALILGAGLGLDYALFFEHAGTRREEQLRTLHALLVCSVMTLFVFSLLALSSIPVLRAIGSTVALSVLGNFIFGLLIARHPQQQETGA